MKALIAALSVLFAAILVYAVYGVFKFRSSPKGVRAASMIPLLAILAAIIAVLASMVMIRTKTDLMDRNMEKDTRTGPSRPEIPRMPTV